jgi:hypothetical protein
MKSMGHPAVPTAPCVIRVGAKGIVRDINNCKKWFEQSFRSNSVVPKSVLTITGEVLMDPWQFYEIGAAQLPLRMKPGSFGEHSIPI